MKCENCGNNEANVKYTQIINGEKKQMFLCEECSQKLGIGNMSFNMPIDFASFLGDFFDDMTQTSFIPSLGNSRVELKCKKCGLDFEDFLHTGNFGCSNCYDEFESMIDPILKNMYGSNRHIGRLGNVIEGNEISNDEKVSRSESSENKEQNELEKLKDDLKQAIKDERYEDAAKLRDEIKKWEK